MPKSVEEVRLSIDRVLVKEPAGRRWVSTESEGGGCEDDEFSEANFAAW